MLTSLGARTMTVRMPRPSRARWTFSEASASSRSSSSVTEGGTSSLSRTFPWTWTTAVTVFEIRFGLELLASGRRRTWLEQEFASLLDTDLERRILAFDQAAADEAGRIAATARAAGRSIEVQDLQIAGIARSRRGTLATHNIRHFQATGVALVDPWAERPGA